MNNIELIFIGAAVFLSAAIIVGGWKAFAHYRIIRVNRYNRAFVKRLAGNATEKELELLKGKKPKLPKFVRMPGERKGLKERWYEFTTAAKDRIEKLHPLYETRNRIAELESKLDRTNGSLNWLRGDVRDAERDLKKTIEFVDKRVVHKPKPKAPPKPPKPPRSESELEALKIIMGEEKSSAPSQFV